MKREIIATHLKGLGKLPSTAEGFKILINDLTTQMGFPLFSEQEINAFAEEFGIRPKEARRRDKKRKTPG